MNKRQKKKLFTKLLNLLNLRFNEKSTYEHWLPADSDQSEKFSENMKKLGYPVFKSCTPWKEKVE